MEPLGKVPVIEEMQYTFNHPKNHEIATLFLDKVNQSITLTEDIKKIFISDESETKVELLGETFIQITEELYKYYQ